MDEITKIRKQMAVVTVDGRSIGIVTLVGNAGITVTSVRDGRGFNHVIPFSWVAEVGKYVFLNKGSGYVSTNWDGGTATGPRTKAA